MGLFKTPKRKEVNIESILSVVENESIPKSKIKLRGTSLLAKLKAIEETVEKNLGDEKDNYLLITSDDEWLRYCKDACSYEYVAYDTECDSLDNMLANLAGVCIKSSGLKSAYVPVGHISTITDKLVSNQISKEAIRKGLQMLVDANVKFLMHNGYFDIVLTYQQVGIMLPVYFDTMICAGLLDENEPHGLKYLYAKYCNNSDNFHKFGELFDGIPINCIPYKVAGIYGQFDAVQTEALAFWQMQYMDKNSSECKKYKLERVADLFWNVEMPMVSVLCKMKIRGVLFDFDAADRLRIKYTALKKTAEQKFYKALAPLEQEVKREMLTNGIMEWPVNYNSPAQIKVIIYDILNSGVIFKKEPTGTGKHVLDTILADKKYKGTILYSIVEALVDVKRYDKLIGTFIEKLSNDARKHKGKIHCNYNQLGAATGRLSSSNPNMQQCPSHNDDIRNMFSPGEHRVFISLDYSQQEMMAVASLANDDKMLESFRLGRDIYSHVASIAFDKPYEYCKEFDINGNVQKEGKKLRKQAKAICLGLCYGKGNKSIQEDLNLPNIEKAEEIRQAVLGAFPKLSSYLHGVVESCREKGFVEDYFGRRRRLPDIKLPPYEFIYKKKVDKTTEDYYNRHYSNLLNSTHSQNEKQKIIAEASGNGIEIKQNGGFIAQAERNSLNSPVQGSASTLTKKAMVGIDTNERLNELDCHLEMSIHDEVCLSVPESNAYEALIVAKREFLGAGKELPADLRCDVEISNCWSGPTLVFNDKHELIKEV